MHQTPKGTTLWNMHAMERNVGRHPEGSGRTTQRGNQVDDGRVLDWTVTQTWMTVLDTINAMVRFGVDGVLILSFLASSPTTNRVFARDDVRVL